MSEANTTHYKGYIIQRISSTQYDVWSPVAERTTQNPSGRHFRGTCLSLATAKRYADADSAFGRTLAKKL